MKKTAFLLTVPLLLAGCASSIPRQAGEIASKGSVIAAGAGGGAVLGGPLGAVVGGVLAYFGVELAEVEVAFDELGVAFDEREQEHAEEVRAAQATGQQQGSDQAATFLAQLRGDADAVKFFREKAGEAIAPLEGKIKEAEAALRARMWGYAWKGIVALCAVFGLLVLIWWLTRKETKAQGARVETLERGNGSG